LEDQLGNRGCALIAQLESDAAVGVEDKDDRGDSNPYGCNQDSRSLDRRAVRDEATVGSDREAESRFGLKACAIKDSRAEPNLTQNPPKYDPAENDNRSCGGKSEGEGMAMWRNPTSRWSAGAIERNADSYGCNEWPSNEVTANPRNECWLRGRLVSVKPLTPCRLQHAVADNSKDNCYGKNQNDLNEGSAIRDDYEANAADANDKSNDDSGYELDPAAVRTCVIWLRC